MSAQPWLLTFLHPAFPDLASGLRLAVAGSDRACSLVDGGSTLTLVPQPALVRHLSWALRPSGDTLWIAWEGAGLACRPLDVVQVWTPGCRAGEDPALHYPRAAGRVSRAPGSLERAGVLRACRAVGLAAWLGFLECDPDAEAAARVHAAGQDVSAVATAMLAGALAGMVAPPLSFRAPGASGVLTAAPLSFAGASLAEALATLAGLAPGREWGVRPDRSVFLEASGGQALLDARQPGVSLNYCLASGEPEGAVSRVRWRLGRGNAPAALYAQVGVDAALPDRLTHLSAAQSEPCGATTIVRAPPAGLSGLEPLALTPTIERGELLATWGADGADLVPSLARLADGEPTSGATVRAVVGEDGSGVTLRLTLPAERSLRASDVVAVEVRLRPNAMSPTLTGTRLRYELAASSGGSGEGRVLLREALGGQPGHSATVVLGDRARCAPGGHLNHLPLAHGNYLRLELRVTGTGDLAAWDVECFRVHVLARSALDAAATGHYRSPSAAPAVVTVSGEVAPAARVSVTLPDGSTPPELQDAPAREWRYAVGRGGISSSAVVGEASLSPAEAERRALAARLHHLVARPGTA